MILHYKFNELTWGVMFIVEGVIFLSPCLVAGHIVLLESSSGKLCRPWLVVWEPLRCLLQVRSLSYRVQNLFLSIAYMLTTKLDI